MTTTFDLTDKFVRTSGTVLLTGNQAIVRIPIDQARYDRAHGRITGTFISGYPGSPVGVLDKAFAAAREQLEPYDIVHWPGMNEEVAAVAIWGSQQNPRPYSKGRTGVVGIWYGKAPGVDRAGDSFRHGQFMGAHPQGGVIVLAGDDPSAKSSTLPTDSQSAFYDLGFPILTPSSVQDVLDLGLQAINLSRFSGNWVGVKLVTDLCDGLATVEVRDDREFVTPPVEVDGRPWQHRQLRSVLTPISLEQEIELFGGRRNAALAYIEANGINVTTRRTSGDRLGIVGYGKPYADLIEAMAQLRLDPERRDLPPIRILKLGASYPLPPDTIRRFAEGLEEILVVEEKRSFVETHIRDILYGLSERPRVVGKLDRSGKPLVPAINELNQARLVTILQSWLEPFLAAPRSGSPGCAPAATGSRPSVTLPFRPSTFCSGCPHSRSTTIPTGALNGGGCGCHSMIYTQPRHKGDDVFSVVPMGTEGSQWIGLAPFVDTPHMYQNLGDGTFFHSGVNALRACIDAGVNMTFKLLFNSAIAMTGGQRVPGARGVEALTRELEAMGVRRTIVCTDDVRKYHRSRGLGSNVAVRPRDDFDAAQRSLAKVKGVTVLLFDQHCAAEARRLRKRGRMATPPARVVINEAVCEGCGDCQDRSFCLSVVPVKTDRGRKTQIDDSSCNRDYTCLEGDCPSFLTVVPKGKERPPRTEVSRQLPSLADPVVKAVVSEDPTEPFNLVLAGIGGTGVMTTNQILAVAAAMDGLSCVGLDQTGLSQKSGPVVSHLRISRGLTTSLPGAVPIGSADAFLAFDPIVGVAPVPFGTLCRERTAAMMCSDVAPTRDMIAQEAMRDGPDVEFLLDLIAGACRPGAAYRIDAIRRSQALFDDAMPANLFVVGAAYQAGLLPLNGASIREAIRLNGVAVDKSLAAFDWGRAAVAGSADWGGGAVRCGELRLAPSRDNLVTAGAVLAGIALPGQLRNEATSLAADLVDFGGRSVAQRYAALVGRVFEAEAAGADGELPVTAAIVHNFAKALAYKDEYEVARLHLDRRLGRDIEHQVGPAKVYFHLHPPFLRALGMRHKIRIRSWWATPMFRALRAMRGLRGTPFDPFGHTRIRRRERRLIDDYEQAVLDILPRLDRAPELALAIAQLPAQVRGFESIKEARIDEVYAALARLRSSDRVADSA
jgi:indolepyruvate ferredoxin oxidoreductase